MIITLRIVTYKVQEQNEKKKGHRKKKKIDSQPDEIFEVKV